MAGDRDRHDEIIRDAAGVLADEVDVIVLAQASLAHLQKGLDRELPVPVLASPPLLMRRIGSFLNQ